MREEFSERAVTDFWTVYEAEQEALARASRDAALRTPGFEPYFLGRHGTGTAELRRAHRENVRRAMLDGDWSGYDAYLDAMGEAFATSSFSLASWHAVSRAYTDELTRAAVQRTLSDPARLTELLKVITAFVEHGMTRITARYIAAKEKALIASQGALDEERARRAQLEAEGMRAKLDESENLFRLLVNSTTDYAMLTLDAEGRVTTWNEGAERIKGYKEEEILGAHISRFYPEEDVRAGKPERELTTALKEGRWEDEGYRVRKDGSRFWANVIVVPMRDAAGNLKGFSKVTRDFSERRHAEEMLRDLNRQLAEKSRRVAEASRMKSEFLANMSHELRTPLNAILGFTELIHDGEVTPDMPEYKEFLGDILTSGRHLLQLINDVLDLSKVEAGRLAFHPETVEIAAIVAEVTGVVRAAAQAKRITIDAQIDTSETGAIVIDAGRLKQVLYNFLSNAIKFTNEGGHVIVRAKTDREGTLRLEVEDSGIGISERDVESLFVEFRQLDAGAAKKHAGTGLGLALTKRIVEAQDGVVGVRSELGKGSLFYAVIPKQSASEASAPQRFDAADPAAPTVLVVEDDPEDSALLVRTLLEAGYTVETAPTATQALAKFRERHFDAITLDLLLDDANGVDVLRAIRREAKNSSVPVIVITVVAERGAVAGFAVHDLLPKPIDSETLLRSLERALGSGARGGRVLVVDDDPASLKLMGVALEQLGKDPIFAADGGSGLAALVREPPSAIVLDLMLPDMSGFEFLAHLRASPLGARIPVLVWTVKDLTRAEDAHLREVAQAIFLKGGGERARLVEELRSFLPAPRARDGRR